MCLTEYNILAFAGDTEKTNGWGIPRVEAILPLKEFVAVAVNAITLTLNGMMHASQLTYP